MLFRQGDGDFGGKPRIVVDTRDVGLQAATVGDDDDGACEHGA